MASTPKSNDRSLADYLFYTSLEESQVSESVDSVQRFVSDNRLVPIAVLPFLEPAMFFGASLASAWSLPCANPTELLAGRDKRIFRNLDQKSNSRPENYRPVSCLTVRSSDEFIEAVNSLGGIAFVKPAMEGGSRGCAVVRTIDDCPKLWDDLAPYHKGGIIVEELVDKAREFSWDYAAGSHWITQKETTEDQYRAEIQQTVPAPLPDYDYALLSRTGMYMRSLTSNSNGVFHNEVFLREQGVTSAVEVNLRPAGMHVWDLASVAFENFDPWGEWLRWGVTGEHRSVPLVRQKYAAIRMLRALKSGTVVNVPEFSFLTAPNGSAILELNIFVERGSLVEKNLIDNYGFIGEILMSNDESVLLDRDIKDVCNLIEGAIDIL